MSVEHTPIKDESAVEHSAIELAIAGVQEIDDPDTRLEVIIALESRLADLRLATLSQLYDIDG